MPQEPQALNLWQTVVTLQISFDKKSITPSFRETLNKPSANTHCSCLSFKNLHPNAILRNLIAGILPSKDVSVLFIVYHPERIRKAKKLCAPRSDQEFASVKAFQHWTLSLITLLSELCESDHKRIGSSHFRAESGIRPYKRGVITKSAICESVRRVLTAPLKPREEDGHGMGYVYILRSLIGATTMTELKISFSKYHPEHRSHELAPCLARPEIIGHTPLLPHAKRLESIIHAELQDCRKIYDCPKCSKEHRGWFTISPGDSREVVTRWGTWILKRPYIDGRLTEDWRNYLTKQDFTSVEEEISVAQLWRTITSEYPIDEHDGTSSQRIGQYLNKCYWDFTFHHLGIEHLGKQFCDMFRNFIALRNSGDSHQHDSLAEPKIMKHELRSLDQPYENSESEYQLQADNDYNSPEIIDMMRSRILTEGSIDPELPVCAYFQQGTFFHRLYHPELKVRHLFNQDATPGPLLRLIQSSEKDSKLVWESFIEAADSSEALKTGSVPVSQNALGRIESPLGDATLLPVISLHDLEHIIPLAANWVGMTLAKSGFWYMQEAYRNGKCVVEKPEFRSPKAYRRAECKTDFCDDGDTNSKSMEAVKERATVPPRSSQLTDADNPKLRQGTSSSQLLRTGNYNRYQWAAKVNEQSFQDLEESMKEMHIGGRKTVEEKSAEVMRASGVDGCFDNSRYEERSDSDSCSCVSRELSSCEAEGSELQPDSGYSCLPNALSKRKRTPKSTLGFRSSKKARMWLQSLPLDEKPERK